MKFFHLADLHLGKRVNGFSMIEDQKYILHQIGELADREKPDAVIIAGDVRPEESDSELKHIGGLDNVDCGVFDAFDYVALGHLHGPQRIGRDTVRYAGSPLKYSFSEENRINA